MDYVKQLSQTRERNIELSIENESLKKQIEILKTSIGNTSQKEDRINELLATLQVVVSEYENLNLDLKNQIAECQVLKYELGNILNTTNMIKQDVEDDSFTKYRLI